MIPATLHFVWLGKSFPWLNALAIVSAAESGGFERIVLHTNCPATAVLSQPGLARLSQLELREIELESLARRAGREPSAVHALYTSMKTAAARSDVLRALILSGEGGVYLDMDTVTVASFAPLLGSAGAFVGQERLCFPNWTLRRPRFADLVRASLLSLARYVLSLTPGGFRAFAVLEARLSLAVNNAVIGCVAHHPFIEAYLKAMLDLPVSLAVRRYAIGPHLLAHVCGEFETHQHPVRVLAPGFFYPLSPVISEQWWMTTRRPDLAEVLSEETLVVHWYASVRSKRRAHQVDSAYIRARRDRELFSRLAARYLHALD